MQQYLGRDCIKITGIPILPLDNPKQLGRLPFTPNAWKFWLENEMVHTIPFETFQKLETSGLISAFFPFFVNYLIDCSTFCDISVLRLDKLQH